MDQPLSVGRVTILPVQDLPISGSRSYMYSGVQEDAWDTWLQELPEYFNPRGNLRLRGRDSEQSLQHLNVLFRGLPAGETPHDVLSPILSQRFSELGIACQSLDCVGERLGILRLDDDAGPGLLNNLLCLTLDTENNGTRAGHEFQHLCRNHGLENVSLL